MTPENPKLYGLIKINELWNLILEPTCFKGMDPTCIDNFLTFTCFFDIILLIEKSTSFPRTFFDVMSMVEKSKLLPRTFIDLISLVKKLMLFPLTFFDVILMVEKSTLFSYSFFDETSTGKNSALLRSFSFVSYFKKLTLLKLFK